MTSNLHPIFQSALAPWMPPAEPVPTIAEQVREEHASGLDAVDLPEDWEPGQ
jgi:hypothetical protein